VIDRAPWMVGRWGLEEEEEEEENKISIKMKLA
jgi:hypothetical protein